MQPFFDLNNFSWYSPIDLENRSYICGYCGDRVSSNRGYRISPKGSGAQFEKAGIYICSNCQGPSFFNVDNNRFPASSIGISVNEVPEELNSLYEEARRCTSHNCYTAAILLCRKMLMNIAVEEGATEGLKFIEYVDYLSLKGFIPPNGKHWVDHIRRKGNEATHEIALMGEQDARDLLTFSEMLLKFIYEFPKMVPMTTQKSP